MPIYKMDGKKKDGLQKYRVRINYTDSTGKAKQTERVAYGKEAAKALEQKLRGDIKGDDKSALTVHQLYDEFIKIKQFEVRENTLRTLRRRLELYVIPELGGCRLNELTAARLQRWKQTVEQQNNFKNPSQPLSLIMKQNLYGALREMLNYAIRMEYLAKNPLMTVGNFKNPYELKKEMDFYTPEEFKKFISTARERAKRAEKDGNSYEWNFYVFFSIAFYTGLRKGEINALKWTDLEGNIIHVRRSIAQRLHGSDKETPPKNRSSIRDVQMPLPLIKTLDDHRKRQEKLSGFSESFYICGGEICLRNTTLQQRNQQYAQNAGIKRIRIHDFRHSHASFLANNGINIQEIARRLGHSDVEITWNVYAHLYPREEERAIAVLNKIK